MCRGLRVPLLHGKAELVFLWERKHHRMENSRMLKINTKRTAPFIAYLIMGVVFLLDEQFGFRGVSFSETHTLLIGVLLVIFAFIFLFTHSKKGEGGAEGGGGSEKSDD